MQVGTIFSTAYVKRIRCICSRISRSQNGVKTQSITKKGERKKEGFMEEERGRRVKIWKMTGPEKLSEQEKNAS